MKQSRKSENSFLIFSKDYINIRHICIKKHKKCTKKSYKKTGATKLLIILSIKILGHLKASNSCYNNLTYINSDISKFTFSFIGTTILKLCFKNYNDISIPMK